MTYCIYRDGRLVGTVDAVDRTDAVRQSRGFGAVVARKEDGSKARISIIRKLSSPQHWLIEWDGATASGNDFATYPDHLTRAQVIARWESAHHGCYVTRLISSGSRFEEAQS